MLSNGDALDPQATKTDNKYYIEIGDIAANQLTDVFDVIVDADSDNVYNAKIGPMTYIYYALVNGDVTDDTMNVLKAICAYSEAARNMMN